MSTGRVDESPATMSAGRLLAVLLVASGLTFVLACTESASPEKPWETGDPLRIGLLLDKLGDPVLHFLALFDQR